MKNEKSSKPENCQNREKRNEYWGLSHEIASYVSLLYASIREQTARSCWTKSYSSSNYLPIGETLDYRGDFALGEDLSREVWPANSFLR
jgi:hypothetical protein